jgi:hypothetical protein
MASAEIVVLYRPVDAVELRLIKEAGFRGFPPRLPEQPFFYPVTNESYAVQIARDWNTKFGSKEGYVTRFSVKRVYLERFEQKKVGGAEHTEYWIPAEELPEFNENIAGEIEVIARFIADSE